MSRRGFLQAIFALADVWVREYSVSEYVKFLQSKWHRVRDLHRQGVAARHIGKGTDPLIGAGMMVQSPSPSDTLCTHTLAHTHAQAHLLLCLADFAPDVLSSPSVLWTLVSCPMHWADRGGLRQAVGVPVPVAVRACARRGGTPIRGGCKGTPRGRHCSDAVVPSLC